MIIVKPDTRHYTFFCLEDATLSSRMLCIENNQLIEGSASSCFCKLLKYHTPVIEIINNQGEFINSLHKFFQWKIWDGHF
jgi:trans-2,3-dihydro-3-hydroxyanthranilate isomerase